MNQSLLQFDTRHWRSQESSCQGYQELPLDEDTIQGSLIPTRPNSNVTWKPITHYTRAGPKWLGSLEFCLPWSLLTLSRVIRPFFMHSRSPFIRALFYCGVHQGRGKFYANRPWLGWLAEGCLSWWQDLWTCNTVAIKKLTLRRSPYEEGKKEEAKNVDWEPNEAYFEKSYSISLFGPYCRLAGGAEVDLVWRSYLFPQ